MTCRSSRVLGVLTILVCCSAAVGADKEPADANLPERLDRAIEAGKAFLISQLSTSGACLREPNETNRTYGGKTALVTYALLSAGAKPHDPPIAAALKWLSQAKLLGVYAVSMRACAYAAVKDDTYLAALRQDMQWLLQASSGTGHYTYVPYNGGNEELFDNSNSQMAILGVWAGTRRGLEVDPAYWKQVEGHWTRCQGPDGGWGYETIRPDRTYGSMTAAGVATLFICFDNLHRQDFVRCAGEEQYPPIYKGIGWLGQNFSVEQNPHGYQWDYYWLYALERVGLASGLKYFGGHDWYAEGIARLLAEHEQRPDGGWGLAGDRTDDTAFALLFMVRGRNPVLYSKLQYVGKWNSRPRDLAHLTEWHSDTFERPVGWQVVHMESPLRDWHDSPILYISGCGGAQFSDADAVKLRTYALQGGLLLSEAACNSADFNTDMQALYKRMFPDLPLTRLPDDHPMYSLHFPDQQVKGVFAVSNGIRLLAIHCPEEVSLALQLGSAPGQAPVTANPPAGRPEPTKTRPLAPPRPQTAQTRIFKFMANVYLYATDKGILSPKGFRTWPDAEVFKPTGEIRLARIKYDGKYDPEPHAWYRLAILLGNRHGIQLTISPPMEIAKLDAAAWPVAAMTGTAAFQLSLADKLSLQKYLASGGTLILDAAGGAKDFADSAEKQILPLVPNGIRTALADKVLLEGPEPLGRVGYRRNSALALGSANHKSRIQSVSTGDRIVIVYSPDDLTAALVGYNWYGINGYSPELAWKMMANILVHLSAKALAPTPAPPR